MILKVSAIKHCIKCMKIDLSTVNKKLVSVTIKFQVITMKSIIDAYIKLAVKCSDNDFCTFNFWFQFVRLVQKNVRSHRGYPPRTMFTTTFCFAAPTYATSLSSTMPPHTPTIPRLCNSPSNRNRTKHKHSVRV